MNSSHQNPGCPTISAVWRTSTIRRNQRRWSYEFSIEDDKSWSQVEKWCILWYYMIVISKLKLKVSDETTTSNYDTCQNDFSRCPGRSPQWSGATSHHRRRCGRIHDLQSFVPIRPLVYCWHLDACNNHPLLRSLMDTYGYVCLSLDDPWFLQICFCELDGYLWFLWISGITVYISFLTKTTSIVIVYNMLPIPITFIISHHALSRWHINIMSYQCHWTTTWQCVLWPPCLMNFLKLVISPWPQRCCSPSDQWPKVQLLMCPERRRRWSTKESPLPSSVKSRLVPKRCPEKRWIKAKEEAWECTSTQDIHKKEPVWRHKQIHKWKESMIQVKICFSLLFSILQRSTNSACISKKTDIARTPESHAELVHDSILTNLKKSLFGVPAKWKPQHEPKIVRSSVASNQFSETSFAKQHNAVAPTLSIHTVSPSSPDPSYPNTKNNQTAQDQSNMEI